MQFTIRFSDPREWHKWFAWHPVSYPKGDGSIAYVWLENVLRRSASTQGYYTPVFGPIYEYKAMQ
jgi:hypothetical protein